MPPVARPYCAEKLFVMTENSCTESSGTSWPTVASNWSLLATPSSRMLVLAERVAVDAEAGAARRTSSRSATADVARDRDEVVGVARQRRQLADLRLLHRGRLLGVQCVDDRRFRDDLDRLRGARDPELRVELHGSAHRHDDSARGLREPGELGGHLIGPAAGW